MIEPDTVKSYRETEYRVYGDLDFALQIGRPSPELLSAHRRYNVDCSAFLTACNPFSLPLEHVVNASRQAELAKELTQRSLVFVPGEGKHPSNGWPGEDSFLIFGLALEAARALGRRFDQNGFVWSGADGVPQLVLLR